MSYIYKRTPNYYETDMMGIVHHSNYIRWMEEARVELLDRLGISFASMEARGLLSPVVGIECRYLRPCRFDDVVQINVAISAFRGVRLVVSYEMINTTTGELACTGASQHCFTDQTGKPIILRKQYPDVDAVLRTSVQNA